MWTRDRHTACTSPHTTWDKPLRKKILTCTVPRGKCGDIWNYWLNVFSTCTKILLGESGIAPNNQYIRILRGNVSQVQQQPSRSIMRVRSWQAVRAGCIPFCLPAVATCQNSSPHILNWLHYLYFVLSAVQRQNNERKHQVSSLHIRAYLYYPPQ